MKIDYVIPASLNDSFCGQAAFFRASLDALGPPYSDARVVVVFGDPPSPKIPARWRRYFDGIDVEWAHNPTRQMRDTFAQQHWHRFEVFRPDCDLVVLCDADVAQLRPMDGMARQLIDDTAIGGVIAHYHFPRPDKRQDPAADWAELGRKILGIPLTFLPHQYTLQPLDSPPQSPFYVNYGVLMAPPDVMTALARYHRQISEEISGFVAPYFAPQVSVALACIKAGLTTKALPMRYNFPNDARADALYPEEMHNIIFMHYLRRTSFQREQIFADPAKFDEFISARLDGSNEIFRRHVAVLTDSTFPFAS